MKNKLMYELKILLWVWFAYYLMVIMSGVITGLFGVRSIIENNSINTLLLLSIIFRISLKEELKKD